MHCTCNLVTCYLKSCLPKGFTELLCKEWKGHVLCATAQWDSTRERLIRYATQTHIINSTLYFKLPKYTCYVKIQVFSLSVLYWMST